MVVILDRVIGNVFVQFVILLSDIVSVKILNEDNTCITNTAPFFDSITFLLNYHSIINSVS